MEKSNEQTETRPCTIYVISNSFICDSCEKIKYNSELVMITDEWFICKMCFEKECVNFCEYSSYCALTGECDESC